MKQFGPADWRALLETLNRSLHMGLRRQEALDFRRLCLGRAVTAAARNPFYRDRLAPILGSSGIVIERWGDIPILTKDELRIHRDAVLVKDPGKESGPLRLGWTAGSEGEPLHYARTALSDFVSNKTTQRFMRSWKMDGNKRFAQIQATRLATDEKPTAAMRRGWLEGHPAGEHHVYPSTTDLNGHLAWLQSVRPAYLKSYPEVLGELARLALRQGRVLRFDLLISGGAILTDEIRAVCRDAFGCVVADFYGAEESGSIAVQCPLCGLYHVAQENVLLEVIRDDGQPAGPGETGRAVVTTLFNDAFPLIRYQIGDYVEQDGTGGCPAALHTIRRVIGRAKMIFRLANGRSLWPFIPTSDLGRLPNVKRYQFVQVALDKVEFRFVPRDSAQGTDEVILAEIVRTFLDPSLKVESIPVAAIERENNRKYMLYRSLLV